MFVFVKTVVWHGSISVHLKATVDPMELYRLAMLRQCLRDIHTSTTTKELACEYVVLYFVQHSKHWLHSTDNHAYILSTLYPAVLFHTVLSRSPFRLLAVWWILKVKLSSLTTVWQDLGHCSCSPLLKSGSRADADWTLPRTLESGWWVEVLLTIMVC